ncbi:SRPBCC family protein [Saccharomonospora sp. NPDC046836]|uniref:SRPBCC family protein n=1 Tax=Saccharomonospora sp. NPDC046836 TaxID=3156921 RepID=UPI0033DC955A
MIDIATQLTCVYREVSRQSDAGDQTAGVLLRRRYPTSVEEVWAAVTNPARIGGWYAPVSGDLHVGGRFQLGDVASGEILRCERPHLLRLGWDPGGGTVQLRLAADDDGGTVLELTHTTPSETTWSDTVPVQLGPGWDVSLLALDQLLRGERAHGPVVWRQSPDVQRFSQHVISAWASATEAAGTAAPAEITRATTAALALHAPDLTEQHS